jgi:4-hydroxy-tetrahydrodipicolinate synthase
MVGVARHNTQWIGGAFAALVTPFENDRIAKKAFADFVAWQIDEGARGLVTGGAMGEAATLSPRERIKLVEIAVGTASGQAPVIAATGTNCTSGTIELSLAAQAAGAAAVIVVAPYYSRPGQEGLFRHYRAIADAVSLPVLIENDPARTAVAIHPDTMARLAELPNIVGVAEWNGENCGSGAPPLPEHFVRLSCDDRAAALFRVAGGCGALSIVANVAPRLTAELHRAADAADWSRATAAQRELRPLLDALRLEEGPGPVKYALSLLRRGFAPHMRLPLVPIRHETASAVVAALMAMNLPQ